MAPPVPYRTEHDSLGDVQVPSHVRWGAQTERARQNFVIGSLLIPLELIHAVALIKKAAAITNQRYGLLDQPLCDAICQAADEVIAGTHDKEFPLSVFQTGSGTHTNMNCNEVIAHRASELLGRPVHPNDDVNKSQSSNDVIPSAIHIAAVQEIEHILLPTLEELYNALKAKATAFQHIVKVGRTHLMDAVPLTLGQEFSGYATQIAHGIEALLNSFPHLRELALGGTAVGTGLNAPKGFGVEVAACLSALTSTEFTPAENPFEALACHDTIVEVHGALKRLGCSLYKIATDIRWMASGPNAGLAELILPANEPGSSIMPGKVNPTQCEAVAMVVAQLLGNDTAITFAATQGNFELNVNKPIIGSCLLQSIALLSDSSTSFRERCIDGLRPNEPRLKSYVEHALMTATALSPHIGYDATARIVHKASAEGVSLKEAAVALGLLTAEEFDQYMKEGLC